MKRSIPPTAALVAATALLWGCGPPTATICKKTIPPGGAGFPIEWTSGSGGTPVPAWATLGDGQCQTLTLAASDDRFNTFTETPPPGWMVTNISCNYTTSAVKIIGGNANPAFQPGDNTVTIDLNEPNVTCTFTNERIPACCDFMLDLSTGQGSGPADQLWSVNNGSAFITPAVSAWMGLPPAQWVQPVSSPTPSSNIPSGTFQYRVDFTVPGCPAGHVELTGSFAADNGAAALLDGNPIPNASCSGPNCFSAPVPLNLSPIAPGPHTLQIDVTNESSYTGLIVNAQLRRVCP